MFRSIDPGGPLAQLGAMVAVSAEFSWGPPELLQRADQQNQALAETRELLTRPLDVQSKEFRAQAIRPTTHTAPYMSEPISRIRHLFLADTISVVKATAPDPHATAAIARCRRLS